MSSPAPHRAPIQQSPGKTLLSLPTVVFSFENPCRYSVHLVNMSYAALSYLHLCLAGLTNRSGKSPDAHPLCLCTFSQRVSDQKLGRQRELNYSYSLFNASCPITLVSLNLHSALESPGESFKICRFLGPTPRDCFNWSGMEPTLGVFV